MDLAFIRALRVHYQAEEGRLARAVGADEADPPPGGDMEGGLGDDFLAAVGLADILESDHSEELIYQGRRHRSMTSQMV